MLGEEDVVALSQANVDIRLCVLFLGFVLIFDIAVVVWNGNSLVNSWRVVEQTVYTCCTMCY